MTKLEETLQLFFAIDARTLDTALEAALEDFEAISREVDQLQEVPAGNRGAALEAQLWHRRLVQAYAISQSDRVAPEMLNFFAKVAAGAVAEAAAQTRTEAPACVWILTRMEELKAAYGLTATGEWAEAEEAPPEYRKLAREYAEKTDPRIHDTVLDFVLRRYRLQTCADLLEKEPEVFRLHQDIGMLVVWGKAMDPSSAMELERCARARLGMEAFRRMKRRIVEIQEQMGRA